MSEAHEFQCTACGERMISYGDFPEYQHGCGGLVVRANAWQGPMWRGCGSCNYVRRTDGRSFCAWCANELRDIGATLAHNLAVAAALCQAFSQGAVHMGHAVLQAQGASPVAEPFAPGCGKAAP